MHLYAFLKAKAAFAFGIYTGIYVALVMIIMVFAPIIVRLSEKAGFEFFCSLDVLHRIYMDGDSFFVRFCLSKQRFRYLGTTHPVFVTT